MILQIKLFFSVKVINTGVRQQQNSGLGGSGPAIAGKLYDNLHADHPPQHHRPLHQLLQTFLLRGRGDCQPHRHAGLNHDVRGGQSEPAQDQLHQDGGYLACVQFTHSLRGGLDSHLRGEYLYPLWSLV